MIENLKLGILGFTSENESLLFETADDLADLRGKKEGRKETDQNRKLDRGRREKKLTRPRWTPSGLIMTKVNSISRKKDRESQE